jgi:dnd system-associated protein 4
MAAPPSRRFEMRLSDDWPNRVYVDKEQYDRMHELTSKASEAEREVPFKSLKEVLMAAAMLGYKMGEKADVTERKEIIFTDYLDKTLDLPLVCCLAIADQKTVEVLNDKKKIITIFESYIKGGFDYLYDKIMAGPDKIQNYAYYLLKEHISD